MRGKSERLWGTNTVTGGQTETQPTFEDCGGACALARSSQLMLAFVSRSFELMLAFVSRSFESCSSSVSFLCAGASRVCRRWY